MGRWWSVLLVWVIGAIALAAGAAHLWQVVLVVAFVTVGALLGWSIGGGSDASGSSGLGGPGPST